MLPFIEKLLPDFNVRKKRRLIEFVEIPGLLEGPPLLQIRAITGAIERDLALLSAALSTNSSVHRRTEPFLFSKIADRTTHLLIISRRASTPGSCTVSGAEPWRVLSIRINSGNRGHKPFLFVRLPATR
jgi:hypothetical protein